MLPAPAATVREDSANEGGVEGRDNVLSLFILSHAHTTMWLPLGGNRGRPLNNMAGVLLMQSKLDQAP